MQEQSVFGEDAKLPDSRLSMSQARFKLTTDITTECRSKGVTIDVAAGRSKELNSDQSVGGS